MVSVVSLDDILHDCSLRSNDLEVEITTTYFWEISRSLTQWEDVAFRLPGFDESEVHDIELDNGFEDRRRLGFLKRFKQKFSVNATYKLLVEKLMEIGRAEDARKLCQVVSRYILQQHESQQSWDQEFREEATILKRKVSSMQKKFEDLVEHVEDSLQMQHVEYSRIRSSLKFIPEAEKERLHSQPEIRSNIYEVKSLEELFFFFSNIWDYLHPGLLHFIVDRFGAQNDKDEMEQYLHALDEFRCHVKVGIFIQVMYNVPKDYTMCSKRITTIMEEGWEDKTLQEVENYRLAIVNEMKCEEFLLKTIPTHSSIAIEFRIPTWIHLDMTDLFLVFRPYRTQKVLLNDDVIYNCSSNFEASEKLQSVHTDLSGKSEKLDLMVTKVQEIGQMLACMKNEHQQQLVATNTKKKRLITTVCELEQLLIMAIGVKNHLHSQVQMLLNESTHCKSELTLENKDDSGFHKKEKEDLLSYMKLKKESDKDSKEIVDLKKYYARQHFDDFREQEALESKCKKFKAMNQQLQDEIESKNETIKELRDEVLAKQLSMESKQQGPHTATDLLDTKEGVLPKHWPRHYIK